MFKRKSPHNEHMWKKYDFPTITRDIICPFCNNIFVLKDRFKVISPSTPLLLSCGHPICSLCAIKQRQTVVCKVCNQSHEFGESGPDKLPPLNLYLIGLLRCSETRSQLGETEKKEPEFNFQPAFESRLEKKFQGACSDCNFAATCKCNQCDKLYCEACNMRIHREALKSHERVNLIDGQTITTNQFCRKHNYNLEFYCLECGIDSCSHCFLNGLITGHEQSHHIINLKEKNRRYIEEYHIASQEAEFAEKQIDESLKMLEDLKTTPEGFENAENEMTQHFIFLHGLLQNIEAKMRIELHSQREEFEENIEELKSKLEEYKAPLQEALMIVKVINENKMEVDLKGMIDKLNELKNVPSRVIKTQEGCPIIAKFVYNRKFLQDAKEHCRLDLFDTDQYGLFREDEIHPDYKLPEEAIGDEIQRLSISNGSSKLEVETEETTPSSSSSFSEDSQLDSSSIKDEELETSTETSPGSSNGFTKTEMEVHILHIDNPSTFYVVEKSNLKEHETTIDMAGKLGKKSRGKMSESDIDKNTRCIAKGPTGVWQRARVLQVSTNHNLDKIVKVFLCDNGRKLELPISSIKKITPDLADRKSFLVEAGLKDIEPVNGSWTESARNHMINILKHPGVNILSIEYAEGPKLIGDIKHMPKDGSAPNSLRMDLVFNGYASWIRGERLQRTNPNSYVRKLFHESLALENFNPVTLSVVESVSTIYVHKADSINREFLQDLTSQLAKECNTADKSMRLRVPEIGMLCALPGGPNGVWARGRILELSGKKMVEVFMVDYGITRKVKFDCVRRLPARHMESQTQAIRIEIKGVKPVSEEASAKAINYMTKLLNKEDVSVVAERKLENNLEMNENNCYLGVVYLKGNLVLLGQLLAQRGYISYDGPMADEETLLEKYPDKESGSNQISQPCLTNGTSNNSSMNIFKKVPKGTKKELKQKKDDPFKLEVRIIRVESPDCIYVSDVSRQTEFENLKHEMNEYYKDIKCIREDPYEVGDNVAAYSPKDKTYLRGKVVEVLSSGKVVVYLYDLAITEELDMDYLHDLQQPFDDLPIYAIRVKLAGISPCGGNDVWLSGSKDKLINIIQDYSNNRFFINKCGNTEGEVIPVELTVQRSRIIDPLLPTKVDFEDIGKSLLDQGYALPVKGSEENQMKTLAIELKKELIMFQPNLTESNLKWQGSKLVQKVNQLVNDDDNEAKEKEISDNEENYLMCNIPLAQKNVKWLPAEEITLNEFEGIATNIDYDGNVYFHCIDQKSTLARIRAVTAKMFKNVIHESCDDEWEVGDICMARYSHDKLWYRGIIVEKKNETYYNVFFIDYGNTEETKTVDLKKRVILLDVPAQASSCKVYGLISEAENFETPEYDKIHNIIVEKINIFTVHERSNNTMICSIFMLSQDKNLIDYLVNDVNIKIKMINDVNEHEQNGKFANSSLSSLNSSLASNEGGQKSSSDDLDVIVEGYSDSQKASVYCLKTDDDISDNELMLEYKKLDIGELLNLDRTLQLEIVIINSCNEFVGHLLENNYKYSKVFKEYTAVAKEWIRKAQFEPALKTIRVGQPCCAQFTDGKWYRAEIINLSDDRKVAEVRYVDYGNESVCEVENLREIDVDWLQVPPLSINCKIWNICRTEKKVDDDVFANMLKDLLENRVLYAKVMSVDSGNEISAELYTEEDCINLVYASLIKDEFLRFHFPKDKKDKKKKKKKKFNNDFSRFSDTEPKA